MIYKNLLKMLAAAAIAAACLISCVKDDPNEKKGGDTDPVTPDEPVVLADNAGVTYQLLVYSFADSDGDKIGDFNGITSKLDYLKSLGASAIWLSPIQTASSYHGYDIEDYSSVNPLYGTMSDFEKLVSAAHEKGIKIYLDYVLNHTSSKNPWFTSACSSETSPYRGFYHFQSTYSSGYYPIASSLVLDQPFTLRTSASSGDVDNITGLSNGIYKFTLDWSNSSNPKLTVSAATTPDATEGNSGKWIYYGDGTMKQFISRGNNIFDITIDYKSDWGFLIRTSSTSWDGNTKYGPNASGWYYQGVFDRSMPDLNYGPVASLSDNATYQALLTSAEGWLDKGVDGFRLDAVKHIYDTNTDNPKFLKKWYEDLNTYYKSLGHSDALYMVGENLSGYTEVAPYYAGLPAMFEFSFWYSVKDGINNSTGNTLVKNLQTYEAAYSKYRSDYIEATKLSNHDEWRTGEDLGKNISKMKLAGCVLLTAPGCPYVYQGEELGYTGNQNSGDEYVRNPMMWTKTGTEMAVAGVNNKYDKTLYTSSISVEAQAADKTSILSLYRDLATLRETYPSLVSGTMTAHGTFNDSNTSAKEIAAWYREKSSEKLLIVHNFSESTKNLRFTSDKLDNMVFSNGTVTLNASTLSMGAYSTAVFKQ